MKLFYVTIICPSATLSCVPTQWRFLFWSRKRSIMETLESSQIGTLANNCHISSHFLAFSIGDVKYFFTNLQTSVIYNSAIIVDIPLLYLANLLLLYDCIFLTSSSKKMRSTLYNSLWMNMIDLLLNLFRYLATRQCSAVYVIRGSNS